MFHQKRSVAALEALKVSILAGFFRSIAAVCCWRQQRLRTIIKMASNSEPLYVSVERAQWEPLHEWESRLNFVEDNLERHGLEKATQLSIVWANMNFLGCRYPVNTESLVSWYPLPTLDELREKRSRRPKIPSRESTAVKKPAPSRQEVSDLISSIRSETEQPGVPLGLVESIGRKLCLCLQCIGQCENNAVRAQKVLEKHTAICNEPVEMTFKESPNGPSCVIVFRGETVMESTASQKKDAKSAVCESLMRKVEEWQEMNILPPCKHATPTPAPHSYTPSHNHYPPPRDHYQHQGNSYHSPNASYHQPRYPSPPSHGSPYPSNDWPPIQSSRGNYYTPRPPRGANHRGYRGGYNRGSYGH